MANEVMKQSSNGFALDFSKDDLELIKRTVCPSQDFTDAEFGLFMYTAKSRGLNPLTKQIYAIKRWTGNRMGMSIQVAIDGFRAVAQRTGAYAGQTPCQWCGSDGVWRDVWLAKEPPMAARVGVLRHDFKEPLYAIALYSDYCQYTKEGKITSMWQKMPSLMLAKCAESLALRKAFPESLSGLYSSDEMAQATPVQAEVIEAEFTPSPKLDRPPEPPKNDTFTEQDETPTPRPCTQQQIEELSAAFTRLSYDSAKISKGLARYNAVETKDLTEAQAAEILAKLAGKAYDKDHTLTAMRKKLMAKLGELDRAVRMDKINEILEANALPGVNTSNDLDAAGLKLVLDVLKLDGEIDANDTKEQEAQ